MLRHLLALGLGFEAAVASEAVEETLVVLVMLEAQHCRDVL